LPVPAKLSVCFFFAAVLSESPADPNALCMLHRLTFQKACLYYALDGHVPTVQAERILDIPDYHKYTIVDKVHT
jgi:hypothetical protein